MLLTLGLILLGVGVLRSRRAPRWAGAVVLLTPIAVNASFTLGLPPVLHSLPFVVGLLVLAYVVERSSRRAGPATTPRRAPGARW